MNLKELKKLVDSGESERIELKSTTGQRTHAMKTVCGMLNALGGFVFFGILQISFTEPALLKNGEQAH